MPKILRDPKTLPGLVWKNLKAPFVQWARRRARPRDTVPATFFEQTYSQSADPWNAAADPAGTSLAAAIRALPRERFQSGLEIGCSIGVTTRLLAGCCDRLLAADLVESALVHARQRCADLPHVSFARMQIPEDWPAGTFDLIVLSEVLYYLAPDDIRRTAELCWKSLGGDGCVLLVNFRQPTGCPCSGDDAVRIFRAAVADRCVMATLSLTDLVRTDLLRPNEGGVGSRAWRDRVGRLVGR